MSATQFSDISIASGISQFEYTWGHAWGDPNGDGLPDVFVSNHYRIQDHNRPYLYINQGDGTFLLTELPDYAVAPDMHGCGWFDYDNDGDDDLLVETGRTKRNYFLENLGGGLFEEAAIRVGLDVPFVEGRTPLYIDQNRDGRLDVIHTAGKAITMDLPPMLMSIQTDSGSFYTLSETQDGNLAELSSTHGILADLNEDGQLNATITTINTQHWYETGCLPLQNASQISADQTIELRTGDFNGDMRSDLFAVRNDQGQSGILVDYYTNYGIFYETDLIDPMSLAATAGPNHGNVMFDTAGYMTYTPGPGFTGNDSVVVSYCDHWGQCSSSRVIFDVLDSLSLPSLPGGDLYPVKQDSFRVINIPFLVHPYRTQLRTILRPETNVHSFSFQVNSDSLWVVTGPPFLLPPGGVSLGAGSILPEDERAFLLRASDSSFFGLPPVVPGSETRCDIGYNPMDSTWTIRQNSQSDVFRLLLSVFTKEPCRIVSTSGFDTVQVTYPDRLYLRSSTGFEDVTTTAGLSDNNEAVAAAVGDFDNDMDLDIYLSVGLGNGNRPNTLLENQGSGQFVAVSASGGAPGTNIGAAGPVSTSDINRDGFLDLFVEQGRDPGNQIPGPYELFINNGNGNHWLEIDLEGTVSNSDGIGASVRVYSGGKGQLRVADGGLHRYAQDDAYIHFGLGPNTSIDSLEVTWPSGIEQALYGLLADQVLRIIEPDTTAPACFAPRGAQLTLGEESLALQWKPVACALSYELVWRPMDSVQGFRKTIMDTAAVIPGKLVKPGQSYAWSVQAYCADSSLGAQGEIHIFRADQPCPAPGNPRSVIALPDSAAVAWDSVPNASAYTLHYKPSTAPAFRRLPLAETRFPLPLSKLFPGASYDWFVQSNCPFGMPGDSTAVQVISIPTLRERALAKPTLHPNAARERTQLAWSQRENLGDGRGQAVILTWQLLDGNGVVCQAGQLKTGETRTLDLTALPAGNYWVDWHCGSRRGSLPLVRIP